MNDLGHHIEAINRADTIEEAFSYFCKVMEGHGYSQVAYSLVTDHISLGLSKMHGLATSYPEDWMKYYTEKEYLPDDPVVIKVKESFAPFFWEDLEKDPTMSEYSLDILKQGAEAGVRDGIAIPLYGVHNEIAGVGLARKEVDKGRDYQFLAGAQLLATHFHEKFRHITRAQQNDVYAPLSKRETDVLSWAAEGKGNSEIGDILGISTETVKTHMKHCYKKLNANSRAYAITKAILLGLIMPQNIMSLSSDRMITEE